MTETIRKLENLYDEMYEKKILYLTNSTGHKLSREMILILCDELCFLKNNWDSLITIKEKE